ncbi:MAG: histidine phosphatase family protein [Thermaerobacter sp.]|nr:histidine phosphatase family protein [Thermaerobacter sp.]
MGNLSGKSLWVMRHGRPDLPPNPFLMDREQFNRFLNAYDDAGLSSLETDRLSALYRNFPEPDRVISSNLPRALKTATLYARSRPIAVDPLFREIPVWLPDQPNWFLNRRWPGEMWWNYLRLHWFRDQEPEGRTLSLRRAEQAIALLKSHQQDADRLAVVSHAGFLMVIIHLLQSRREIAGRRLPHINFGQPTRYVWR